MKDYQKTNRVLSITVTASCLAVVASYFLSDWQWLNDVNYTLHEMVSIPILIGYFLIPIEVVAGLVFYVKYKRKSVKSVANMLLNFSAVIALLACITTISFFSGRSTTSGFEASINKYEMNDSYYVELNHMPIKITKAQYSEILQNEPYMYTYDHTEWLGKNIYKVQYLNHEGN